MLVVQSSLNLGDPVDAVACQASQRQERFLLLRGLAEVPALSLTGPARVR